MINSDSFYLETRRIIFKACKQEHCIDNNIMEK